MTRLLSTYMIMGKVEFAKKEEAYISEDGHCYVG